MNTCELCCVVCDSCGMLCQPLSWAVVLQVTSCPWRKPEHQDFLSCFEGNICQTLHDDMLRLAFCLVIPVSVTLTLIAYHKVFNGLSQSLFNGLSHSLGDTIFQSGSCIFSFWFLALFDWLLHSTSSSWYIFGFCQSHTVTAFTTSRYQFKLNKCKIEKLYDNLCWAWQICSSFDDLDPFPWSQDWEREDIMKALFSSIECELTAHLVYCHVCMGPSCPLRIHELCCAYHVVCF